MAPRVAAVAVLLAALRLGAPAAAHVLMPPECSVGDSRTDCASVGACICFEACEKMMWLWGQAPYCHDTKGKIPASFQELLRRAPERAARAGAGAARPADPLAAPPRSTTSTCVRWSTARTTWWR